jgi:outer membrane protein OmpA-like peptidoglycan-associated protein
VSYLNSQGIDIKRLKAEGKGETEIRNRCVNGIDCSDKEHEYNRRTEFKFSKK